MDETFAEPELPSPPIDEIRRTINSSAQENAEATLRQIIEAAAPDETVILSPPLIYDDYEEASLKFVAKAPEPGDTAPSIRVGTKTETIVSSRDAFDTVLPIVEPYFEPVLVPEKTVINPTKGVVIPYEEMFVSEVSIKPAAVVAVPKESAVLPAFDERAGGALEQYAREVTEAREETAVEISSENETEDVAEAPIYTLETPPIPAQEFFDDILSGENPPTILQNFFEAEENDELMDSDLTAPQILRQELSALTPALTPEKSETAVELSMQILESAVALAAMEADNIEFDVNQHKEMSERIDVLCVELLLIYNVEPTEEKVRALRQIFFEKIEHAYAPADRAIAIDMGMREQKRQPGTAQLTPPAKRKRSLLWYLGMLIIRPSYSQAA